MKNIVFGLLVWCLAAAAQAMPLGKLGEDCVGRENDYAFDKEKSAILYCESGKRRVATQEERDRVAVKTPPMSRNDSLAAAFREARPLFIQPGMLFTINRCLFTATQNDDGGFTLRPVLDGPHFDKRVCRK